MSTFSITLSVPSLILLMVGGGQLDYEPGFKTTESGFVTCGESLTTVLLSTALRLQHKLRIMALA